VPLSGRTTFAYRPRPRGRSNTKSCFFSGSKSRNKNGEIELAAELAAGFRGELGGGMRAGGLWRLFIRFACEEWVLDYQMA
jgi:hypothetical protein